VWCLSPDRLARVYAYPVIVLDELARHGVSVRFTAAPPLDDDPQAKLLTQVQGVIAEYERAKMSLSRCLCKQIGQWSVRGPGSSSPVDRLPPFVGVSRVGPPHCCGGPP
jgi:Resolvase, N terminal domain